MTERTDEKSVADQSDLWKIMRSICSVVILLSVLGCIIVAYQQSVGLTAVTVTSLNPENEPRDPGLPLLDQKHTLPDYAVRIQLTSGRKIDLGSKPNTSAAEGLTWQLNEAVAVSSITSVVLREQDQVVSDTLEEVQVTADLVRTDSWQFQFQTQKSFATGLRAFFGTPIGLAICAAFFVAAFLMALDFFLL
ncbi:MAG: hypothetical protein ACO3FE_16200 [Planctomycetaceae bacterium]|jgi:hypothetical protein